MSESGSNIRLPPIHSSLQLSVYQFWPASDGKCNIISSATKLSCTCGWGTGRLTKTMSSITGHGTGGEGVQSSSRLLARFGWPGQLWHSDHPVSGPVRGENKCPLGGIFHAKNPAESNCGLLKRVLEWSWNTSHQVGKRNELTDR